MSARLIVLSALFGVTLAAHAEKVTKSSPAKHSDFSGSEAFAYTREAVSFGERPSGSAANTKLRDWIVSELKASGGDVSLDSFTGYTPKGPIPMANVIVKFPGTSGRAVVVSGHFDTKNIAMTHFVGANDAGSSTGILIEMSRVFAKLKHADDLYLVFFDGEEAVENWTDTDSCYGSQHLVSKWGADGTLSKVKALINVDMVGDKDLDVLDDDNSSQSLRDMVFAVASELNDSKYFLKKPAGIDDDHIPFVKAGVNSIDLIDFDFGPQNSYWHTAQDTMDKLSPHSLQVVGDVVVGVTKRLEAGS
jgi:glutaminyl-peptide cyclotransferase